MSAPEYTIRLENFSGPLDLLLYLVRQEEVEIHDIPIATICDRYLDHLKNLSDLDVEVAAEFLVVAATLMVIKSRSLLPVEEEVDLDEELDPEDHLIQQLLEYKRFKVAARDLADLAEARSRMFANQPPKRVSDEEIPLEDVDLWDLVKAFAKVLEETGLNRVPRPRLIKAERTLREYIDDVFALVKERKSLSFAALFEDRRERTEVIGRFLAILELVRRQRVAARQGTSFESIEIVLLDDRDYTIDEILAAEADQRPAPVEDDGLDGPAPTNESSAQGGAEADRGEAAGADGPTLQHAAEAEDASSPRTE